MYSLKLFSGIATGLFFSLTPLTFLGCVMPNSGDGEMQVEVDVFSGRPNPQWNLTSQEADEFVALFRTLPQQPKAGTVSEGLGYRGLIVTKPGESIEGYNEILISNQIVVARQNSQSKQFVDRDRRLERWLFQTGVDQLDPTLYQQLSTQFK
jgi:hypothetical protein